MPPRDVPMHRLRCPTCRALYPIPLDVKRDEPEGYTLEPRTAIVPRAPYVECPQGHRWTVNTVTRYSDGRPDDVLLGRYIGGGDFA